MRSLLSKYGYYGVLSLVINLVRTKLIIPKARLIRFPIDIRNKANIDFGYNLTTGVGCRIEAYPKEKTNNKCLRIGNNVEMNDFVHIVSSNSVIIGDNVLFASKIFISDTSHGIYDGEEVIHCSPLTRPNDRPLVSSFVIIENNVWIGEFVSILPGVTIGEGSIIGTMSVVTKSIPSYSIAIGSPARVIKRYNFDINKWEKI